MSFVVKAQSASDLSKPPAYSQVAGEDVILKGRESRLDRPHVYRQSPRTSSSDATLPLDPSKGPDSVSPQSDLSQRLESTHLTSPDNTASSDMMVKTTS